MTERLGLVIKRTEQVMIAAKEKALRPFNLTVPQFAALRTLLDLPGASGAELARRCLVTPQTMTAVLAKLESKELIVRRQHPYHRNLHEIELTGAGRTLVKEADRVTLAVEKQLAGGFSDAEVELLHLLLGRCIDNLAH